MIHEKEPVVKRKILVGTANYFSGLLRLLQRKSPGLTGP
jgi:hypothetical protein